METKLTNKPPGQKSLKYGMFVSSSTKEDQIIGNVNNSTNTHSYNQTNSHDSEMVDPSDPSRDLLLLQCSLCLETCKRGIKTDCCWALACRGCATKEVTRTRTCWSCNALGLSTNNLVNHDLLRVAVDHYKAHQTLLPQHRDSLRKKIKSSKVNVSETSTNVDLLEVQVNPAMRGDMPQMSALGSLGSETDFEKKVEPCSKSNNSRVKRTFNTTVGGDSPALGSENVGHKLLAMMGWAGGGLGKDGSGISEPITAHARFGREGLGIKDVIKKNNLKPHRNHKKQRKAKITPSKQQKIKKAKNNSGLDLNLDYDNPLHSFIVVMLDNRSDEHPCNILKRSGTFSKMQVGWKYEYFPNGSVSCTVEINNDEVCKFWGKTKKEARDNAAEDAINVLQSVCYTIKIKSTYPSDGKTVDLTEVEVSTATSGDTPVLGSQNNNNQLVTIIGESEQELEMDEYGMSGPITADSVIGGIGVESEGCVRSFFKKFDEKVKKIMEDYMLSCDSDDLVFSTGFDNKQRFNMHKIARTLGLKSKSFGEGEGRFLTVSRKQVDGFKLLKNLVEKGGSTDRYTVLEPGEPDTYRNRFFYWPTK